VLEPLHALRLVVEAPEHGLRADLTFVRRSAPIEEPHFRHQVGMRVMFDYTRLTQFGGWEGWVEVDGEVIDLDPGETWGSRDRSWGVRPVGERGSTGAPIADPQFFWLWAPINFETFSTHFDVNELFDGKRWHETGVIAQVDTGDGVLPEAMRSMDYRVGWTPGTRSAEWFEIDLVPWVGEPSTVRLEPLFHFQMLGIGYGHPEWSHGVWKGELAVGGDRWDLPIDNPNAYEHVHIQAIVRATTTVGSASTRASASSSSSPSAGTPRPVSTGSSTAGSRNSRARPVAFVPGTNATGCTQVCRMDIPPSTGIAVPLTNDALGRHRFSVMCATSSGAP
jgi:hypothetical protein